MRKKFLTILLSVFLLTGWTTGISAELKKELFSPEEWERMKKLGIVSEGKEKKKEQRKVSNYSTSESTNYPKSHGKVLGKILLPTKDPIGFTFGPQNTIFYTDWSLKKIIGYNYKKKKIMWRAKYPSSDPNGLVCDGKYIWAVGGKSSRELYKYSKDGELIEAFKLPGKNPSGIEYFQGHLWISDWEEPYITKVSKKGKIIERIPTPEWMRGIFGLAWDGNYLWCAVRKFLIPFDIERKDWICEVYPGCTDREFRGLEYKDGYLYIMNWPTPRHITIYQPPHSGEKVRIKPTREVIIVWMFTFFNKKNQDIPAVYGYTTIPSTNICQDVISFESSPPIESYIRGKDGTPYGKIKFPEIKANSFVSLYTRTKYRQYETTEAFSPHDCGSLDNIPEEIRGTFLSDHPMLNIHHPTVQQCAQEASKGETNPFWLARNIEYYLRDRIVRGARRYGNTAPDILRDRAGVCTHFTRAYVALSRALGLPARHVRTDGHSWPEVYMPGPGEWLTTDGSWPIRGYGNPIMFKRADAFTTLEIDNTLYISLEGANRYLAPSTYKPSSRLGGIAGKNYRCRYSFTLPHQVWNKIGESSPAHTGILGAKILDATSVKLFWDPALTWNDGPVKYEVYISTKNWNTWEDSWRKRDYFRTVRHTNYIITGLTPGATYYCGVLAKNKEGFYTMPESTTFKFTMPSDLTNLNKTEYFIGEVECRW